MYPYLYQRLASSRKETALTTSRQIRTVKKTAQYKEKKIPQLQNVNSFSEEMCAHSSRVITYSSVPKVNWVRVS